MSSHIFRSGCRAAQGANRASCNRIGDAASPLSTFCRVACWGYRRRDERLKSLSRAGGRSPSACRVKGRDPIAKTEVASRPPDPARGRCGSEQEEGAGGDGGAPQGAESHDASASRGAGSWSFRATGLRTGAVLEPRRHVGITNVLPGTLTDTSHLVNGERSVSFRWSRAALPRQRDPMGRVERSVLTTRAAPAKVSDRTFSLPRRWQSTGRRLANVAFFVSIKGST